REFGGEHPLERSAIPSEEKSSQIFQPLGFEPEVTRRPNQLRQFRLGQVVEPARREDAAGTEVLDGLLDVPPGGILSQDGPDDHLERRFGRPPLLRAISRVQPIVEAEKGAGTSQMTSVK